MELDLASGVRRIGVVLAGGMSVRMGRDKARIVSPRSGSGGAALTWLEHTLTCLAPFVEECHVVGRTLTRDDCPNLASLPSSWPDGIRGRGPLGGIETAFAASGDRDLIVAACDLPQLAPWVVDRLVAEGERAPGADAVAFTDGGRVGAHAGAITDDASPASAIVTAAGERRPLLAGFLVLFRPTCRDGMTSALDAGVYGLQRFLSSIDTRWVSADERIRFALRPANTPEDIEPPSTL